MFIYLIVNHVTGKYYVGQHKGDNLKRYLQQKLHEAWHHNGRSHLYASMRKHPRNSWSIHALRSDIQDKAELDQTERDFIKFLRAQNSDYGYNICRGGEGNTISPSQETRKKISDSVRKAMLNPEICFRMMAGLRKGWTDPRSHAKKAESVRTPERRAKSAETIKGLHNLITQAKAAETRKEMWNDPIRADPMRAQASENGKRGWSNPASRDKAMKSVRRVHADPLYRSNMSKIKKGKRFGPEFCIKMSEVAKKREAKKREAKEAQLPSIVALR